MSDQGASDRASELEEESTKAGQNITARNRMRRGAEAQRNKDRLEKEISITHIEIAHGLGKVSKDHYKATIELFLPETKPIATAIGNTNPFTITDATAAGVEKIAVAPGYIEVITAGFSTMLMPTMSGSPLDDVVPPTLGVVSGDVFLEVTIGGSEIPTVAEVKNASTMPADTDTLKHILIGTITVIPNAVTVDSQDLSDNVRYFVKTRTPLSLYFATVAGDVVVRIRYGTIDGVVPPQVQGGSSPSDASPIAAKYWAKSEYNADGQTGVVSIDGGSTVPDDSETATYYLIGEVQIISSTPVIFQAITSSLTSFRCGKETYSWGGA